MTPATFTLANKEIMPMFESLFALDGRSQGVDGSDRPRPLVPFKFKGDLRLAIGRNIKALTPVYEELQDQKKKMRVDLLGSAEPIENERKHENFQQLESEWRDLMAGTQDIQLYVIKWDDLRAEDNGIAPTVISSLLPIIKTD